MEVSVFEQAARSERIEQRQAMQAPQDVEAMLKPASLGSGTQRVAAELGCSCNTVKRYMRQGGWQPYESPARLGHLSGHAEWLATQSRQHRGNCDVVRQELLRVHGIEVMSAHRRAHHGPPAPQGAVAERGDGALRDTTGPSAAG